MKFLNRENIFVMINKINFLLTVSVIILVVFLCINLLSAQQPFTFNYRDIKNKSELIDPVMKLDEIPVFQESIFKRGSMFTGSLSQPLLEHKLQQEEVGIELLGLVSVGDKTAAMIRDIREKKNYYCVGGEEIGGFKVKQVLKDKVILESEGKMLELSR